jgi:hypothetical protein
MKKPIPFNPATAAADPLVYQSGYIDTLISQWGLANTGGVRFYTLDNEPSLWTDIPIGPSSDSFVNVVENDSAPDTIEVSIPLSGTGRIFGRIVAYRP